MLSSPATPIMTRLARGRTIRFSSDLPPRYFEELGSERRVIRYRAGSPYRSWERIGNRVAECLDSTAYAFCSRYLPFLSPFFIAYKWPFVVARPSSCDLV